MTLEIFFLRGWGARGSGGVRGGRRVDTSEIRTFCIIYTICVILVRLCLDLGAKSGLHQSVVAIELLGSVNLCVANFSLSYSIV